jgi:hypothetical protein
MTRRTKKDITKKTVTYFIRLYFSDTLDNIFITQWKTVGAAWKPTTKAPSELQKVIDGDQLIINNFRRCRSGKFFCGTVTVTSNLTRMGIWFRRQRKADGNKPT